MGVSPYVNRLYSDLTDGLIIFQLYDIIKPGSVDWKKVTRTFKEKSAVMERIGLSCLSLNPSVCLFVCLSVCPLGHSRVTTRIIGNSGYLTYGQEGKNEAGLGC